jgi:2-dehydro-3-deoxyphosphogluconate aldolase / (4S)-4-hydroxy-2-oxoglutarate aldolase
LEPARSTLWNDARRAADAGARFLVLPALTLPVLEHAVAHDIAVLPGAMTPTEISTALASRPAHNW